MSINDEPVKSLAETEQTLKRLPKGPVKIVAMPPPTNVTNDDQIPPINVTTNNRTPPTNVTNDDQGQHTVSPTEDALSDKGIITVEVSYLPYIANHTMLYISYVLYPVVQLSKECTVRIEYCGRI